MKRNDFQELQKLGPLELRERVESLKAEYYRLRFQQKMGQLKETSSLGNVRRDIARVMTLLNQKQNG